MGDVLSLRNASLGYRRQVVLHVPELSLSPGAVAVLRGPSGSGKSTLLRCAAGLSQAISGEVRYTGSRIAWVPQADRLDGNHPVNVEEVLLAGAGRYLSPMGRLHAKGREVVEGALASLGLEGLARRPFAELSGGQRQRVLVARAILSGADLAVLDEPTSALDGAAAARVAEAVRGMSAAGAAVLIASHDEGGDWGANATVYGLSGGTMHQVQPH